jgi:hypothetical protein
MMNMNNSIRMNEVVMKILLTILGILLTLVGAVWILQGFNILLGSMMSGQIQYAILGLVVAAIGIALVIFSNRRRGASGGEDRSKLNR